MRPTWTENHGPTGDQPIWSLGELFCLNLIPWLIIRFHIISISSDKTTGLPCSSKQLKKPPLGPRLKEWCARCFRGLVSHCFPARVWRGDVCRDRILDMAQQRRSQPPLNHLQTKGGGKRPPQEKTMLGGTKKILKRTARTKLPLASCNASPSIRTKPQLVWCFFP